MGTHLPEDAVIHSFGVLSGMLLVFFSPFDAFANMTIKTMQSTARTIKAAIMHFSRFDNLADLRSGSSLVG